MVMPFSIHAYLFLGLQTPGTQRKWFYNLLWQRNAQMRSTIQQENKHYDFFFTMNYMKAMYNNGVLLDIPDLILATVSVFTCIL